MFDLNEISPLEWDDIADGVFDTVDNEIRAARLLLNADPPLAAPSVPHSLMAAEYLLFLTVQILGAPKKKWQDFDEYIQFIADEAPDLRRVLGPLTALKKASTTGMFDEDILKVAESAFRAAIKAEKILGGFIDDLFDKMYTAQEAATPSEANVARGPGKECIQAQEIVTKAWNETSVKKRATLAKKALALCPHMTDAYVIQGNDAYYGGKLEEAIGHYRKGIEAGETELGKEAFEEMTGHFWMAFETRPYMRARLGLASSLYKNGVTSEAVEHFKEMLVLNPNDNQGVRYMLMDALLTIGLDADAETLFKQYDEDSAFWCYAKALLDFKKKADSKQAQKSRAAALQSNQHIPAYLLGTKKLPKSAPDNYGNGDEDEASIYAIDYGTPWKMTPGALDWLAAGI